MAMQWIMVLKKVERPDKSIALELVLDKKMSIRSKLEGIISDPILAQKFVSMEDGGRSMHAYKFENTDMFSFIRILASIKACEWNVFTSNAYSLGPNSDVIQTFYFEKTVTIETQSSHDTSSNSGSISTPFSGNERSNLDHRSGPQGSSKLASLFSSSPSQEPSIPTPKAQTNPSSVFSGNGRIPGPVVSSVVTIASNHASNVSLASASDHPLGEPSNNTDVTNPIPARRTSIQSSLSSLSGSGEPPSDNNGAVARRTSISSSLSSLSSGDAYLFARKVAERERINNVVQEVKPPPPPAPKQPVAPKAPKMTDDDAQATGLQLKTRALLGKARRERGAIPKFVASEELTDDIILIPTKSGSAASATKSSNPPATPPPPPPPQSKVPAYLINSRIIDPLSSTPSPSSSLSATPTSAGSSAGNAGAGPPTPSGTVRRPSVFGNRPPPAVPQPTFANDPLISPPPASAPLPPPPPVAPAPIPAPVPSTSSSSTSVMDKIRRFSNPFSSNPTESTVVAPSEPVEEPKKKLGLSFLKAPRVPTFNGSSQSSPGTSDNLQQQKNAEHFRKLKEEEAREQKKRLEEEASMDAETQRRLRESEQQAQAHEASKTAHYSRLGSAFAKGGSVLATSTAPRLSRPSETSSTLAAISAQVQADSTSNRSSEEGSTRVSFADEPRYSSTNQEVSSDAAHTFPTRGGPVAEPVASSAESSGLSTSAVGNSSSSSLSSSASTALPAARPVSKGLSFLKAPRTAVADPKASSTIPEWQQRNNEHFKRLAEDEERERRRKAEEEASLDAESLRRLKEAESQAQAHDASKTAHYTRLGSAFARTTLTRTTTGPAKR